MPRNPNSLPWLIQAINSHNSNSCLLWPFGTNKLGYGTMRFMGATRLAHRVAFYLVNGHWPEPCGMHTCDTPSCVSPRHIVAGTNTDNVRDAMVKGRLRPVIGERCNTAKLNADTVRQIRREYIRGDSGEHGQTGLAKKYGICQTAIGSIVNRRSWRHID